MPSQRSATLWQASSTRHTLPDPISIALGDQPQPYHLRNAVRPQKFRRVQFDQDQSAAISYAIVIALQHQ